MDTVLNDLSSDCSSSISFKSNYKFYEYFRKSDVINIHKLEDDRSDRQEKQEET